MIEEPLFKFPDILPYEDYYFLINYNKASFYLTKYRYSIFIDRINSKKHDNGQHIKISNWGNRLYRQ